MATRIVTGPILGPHDEPLADFIIKFAVTKGADGLVQYASSGHYPWLETEVTTDDAGDFNVELATGIRYAVSFVGAFVENPDNNSVWRPPGTGFALEIVVPPGDTAISLQTIRALGGVAPSQTVAEIIQDAIAEYMTSNGIADVIEKVDSIEPGATANAPDADLRDRATHTGEQSIDTITGLQDALNAIPGNLADVATSGSYTDLDDVPEAFPPSPHTHDDRYTRTTDLGTAAVADASDFATAAQGALADTAVQPSAALTDAIDQRHEHANKALLDTVTPELLVPGGGVAGQVLTAGDGGERGWGEQNGTNPFISGWINSASHGMGEIARATIGLEDGWLRMSPIFIPRALIIQRMGVSVVSVETPGLARLGLFQFSHDSGIANVVVDAGTVEISSVGDKIIQGVDTELAAGWYLTGIQLEGEATFVAITPSFYLGHSAPAGGQRRITRVATGRYGAFPASINMSTTTGAFCVIGLFVGEIE